MQGRVPAIPNITGLELEDSDSEISKLPWRTSHSAEDVDIDIDIDAL